jgi:hypothetical protein
MEKFDVVVDIDVTTFRYTGSTTDCNRGGENSSISFSLTDPTQTELTISQIKASSKFKPEYTNKFVSVWQPENWRSDKRPIISVQMPTGLAGLRNPPQFRFISELEYNKVLNPVEED